LQPTDSRFPVPTGKSLGIGQKLDGRRTARGEHARDWDRLSDVSSQQEGDHREHRRFKLLEAAEHRSWDHGAVSFSRCL
jgi:hypothetical protein